MKDRILSILEYFKIPFALSGRNLGKKAIAGLNCPFCGDDTGFHLGILDNGYYSCWRNKKHRGNIYYLISYITKQPIQTIQDMFTDIEIKPVSVPKKIIGGVDSLILPKEFLTIEDNPKTKVFYNYLKNRGFDDAEGIINKYSIKCAIGGKWDNRIIFPLYQYNELMAWIGRSVATNPYLRYKDLSIMESVRHAKFCLWNFDKLIRGGKLVITEGIFDAMKIDWYTNIPATCVFTTSIRQEQIQLLSELELKKIVILFDNNAELQSIDVADTLSLYCPNVSYVFLPEEFKDAGEMSKYQIQEFIGGLNL
jgi:hypothetical protein